MKRLMFLLLVSVFVSCGDDEPEDKNNNTSKYTVFESANIKDAGDQYYTFSTNSASSTIPANYDLMLGIRPWVQPIGNCAYMAMPSPVLVHGTELSIAKLEAKSLDSVNAVPADSLFKTDLPANPVIGFNWFDFQARQLRNDTYAIKTCQGNYGLLQVVGFEYNPTTHQVVNLRWAFMYNPSSTDFSAAELDTFTAADANTIPVYFSFAEGNVEAEGDWQIKLVGENLWLANDCTAQLIAETGIDAVTNAPSSNYTPDFLDYWVTQDWYTINQNTHLLTPKDFVYVVKTKDGKYPAFRIISYYDDFGKSGAFTIEWKYLQ